MADKPQPDGDSNQPKGDPKRKDISQIELILSEFDDGVVEVWPEDWRREGAGYLCHAGSVLVRDADLDRVMTAFGRGRREDGGIPHDGGIGGVTRLDLPPVVPDEAPQAFSLTQRFLEYGDRLFGRGVVTPRHLFYVCSVSPCPATEPEEVPPGIPPDPLLPAGATDGRGVKVVVLDVGWTDAPAAYWLNGVTGEPEPGYDPVNKTIGPYAGHGTFIAGVVRSIARNTEVVVKSYFDKAGAAFEDDLAVRLDEVLAESPDIISLSAGTSTRNNLPSLSLDVFIKTRVNRINGLVLVAAAGNENSRQYFWPAAFPEVVSVGALAENGRDKASFSNFGTWVDVYSPGENLVNAFLTGTYTCTEPPNEDEKRNFTEMARWSGTSFSTPLVAGLIAGRMSATGESARQAADALLAYALTQPAPGVGPVLLPGDAGASIGP